MQRSFQQRIASALADREDGKEDRKISTMFKIFAEQNAEREGLVNFAIRSLYEICKSAPSAQAAYSAIEPDRNR
jgi:hypothetical protein